MLAKLGDWVLEQALIAAIGFGLLAGLLGAFGRARDDGQRPDREWLFNRLLIMPFLGIVAAAAGETVLQSLPRAIVIFVSAILSLAAYDAVRLIERGSLKRLHKAIAGEEAVPPTFEVAHRPTSNPEQVRHNSPMVRPIESLRDIVPLESVQPIEAAILDQIDDKTSGDPK